MLEWRILRDSLAAHVRNANDNRIQSVETDLGHRDVHVPRSGEARRRIEEILAVVHVDDWKTTLTSGIPPWKRHEEIPLVIELRTVNRVDSLDCAERISRSRATAAE